MDGWDGANLEERGPWSPSSTTSTGGARPYRGFLDALVKQHGTILRFASNELICRPSDVPDSIHVIISGWAQRYQRLEDGRRQILRFLIPGDLTPAIAVFKAGRPLNFAVRAITPVETGVIDLRLLRQLAGQSESLRVALFEELCDQIVDLEQRLTDLGVCNTPTRVVHLLLHIYERLSARGMAFNGAFEFPLRQDDIARAVGVTPVHVNRTLVQLRRLGLISYERGRMHLPDVAALRRVAAAPTVVGAEQGPLLSRTL